MISDAEAVEWLNAAKEIVSDPSKRRSPSEVESLARGLRWVKDNDTVQSALEILESSKIVDHSGTTKERKWAAGLLQWLCKFDDLSGRK